MSLATKALAHPAVVKAHSKLTAVAHSRRKFLLVAAILFCIALWLHGEHGSVTVIALSLRDRIIDALGDVFMDRGINS